MTYDSPSAARLVVTRGPNLHQEYTLPRHDLSLGRSAKNDIVFGDPEISRQHAQIAYQQGSYFIADWGSTNGTFVNGQRVIGQTRLQDGDEIELGDAVRLEFQVAASQAVTRVDVPIADSSLEVETRMGFSPEPWTPPLEQTPEIDAWSPGEPAVAPGGVHAAEDGDADSAPSRSSRRVLLGCGCAVIALAFLCAAALFFLDSYDQGRLLYCGALRPFWEIVLGPFGFTPACF